MTLRDLLTKDKILQGLRNTLSPAVLGMLPVELLVDIREVLNDGIGNINRIIQGRKDRIDNATQRR